MSDDLEFLRRVLRVFAEADCHSDLLSRVDGDQITLFANVSDVFAWGSADAEDITPDTFADLQRAFTDLKALGGHETIYTPELFAARRRGTRPQGTAYPTRAATRALFDACAPRRSAGLGNPQRPPTPTGDRAVPAAETIPNTLEAM